MVGRSPTTRCTISSQSSTKREAPEGSVSALSKVQIRDTNRILCRKDSVNGGSCQKSVATLKRSEICNVTEYGVHFSGIVAILLGLSSLIGSAGEQC